MNEKTDTCPDCSSIPCHCEIPAGYTPTPRERFRKTLDISTGVSEFLADSNTSYISWLERELTAVTEQRDQYKAALQSADNHNHEIATKLEIVTEQRDEAREACSPSFDTTETDAAWSAHCIDPDSASGDPWDLAKKLETELTAAREELADWHNAAQQVKAEYPDEVHCSCVAILRKQLKDVTEQRDRLADLVKQFIYILDITEESDSGRLFHPTNITSCRAGDLQKAGELVEALRRAVKGGNDES